METELNTKALFLKVIEINELVGNHSKPCLATLTHQTRIIRSEIDELLTGIRESNEHEIRDGIADVLFTVAGMYGRMGLTIPTEFYMSELRDTANASVTLSILAGRLSSSDETEEGIEQLYGALKDLVGICYGVAFLYNFPVLDDLNTVILSNWSKFDSTPDDAEKTRYKYSNIGIATRQELRETSSGRKLYVTYSLSDQFGEGGKEYPAGKWLKSVNFQEPNFN